MIVCDPDGLGARVGEMKSPFRWRITAGNDYECFRYPSRVDVIV
jgi:hypothetical protein